MPKFAKKFTILGEVEVVTKRKKMPSTMKDRGTLCIIVSYYSNADGDVCTMYNPIMNQGCKT